MRTPIPLNNASPKTALSALIQCDTKDAAIDIATAKFSLYAWEALRDKLEAASVLRLLICSPNHDLQGTDAERAKALELTQSILARDLFQFIDSHAEVRAIDNPMASLTVIQGSSDNTVLQVGPQYTLDGLGALPSAQNYQGIQMFDEMVVSMDAMFENNWNSAKDISESYLDRLKDIFKDRAPREIYEYALYRMFEYDDTGQSINKDTGIADTIIYKSLYNFQRDAMNGAIEKIEKYNGCILADSVGLGKTYTALAIIKYYEKRNYKVLVLAPKKLRENWVQYNTPSVTNPFEKDRFSYIVLNHTDLTRKSGKSGDIELSTVNLNNFDLIVIDESHNFRTDSSEKETASETRYQRLLRAIQSGVKKKILMLTATPVNIKLKDLQSQINFITEKNDEALESASIHSIKQVITKSQKAFNQWMKLNDDERTLESIFQSMNPDYFTLLETLTIARSRKLIEHFYDTKDIGTFPTRRAPRNITPESLITDADNISVESIAKQLDSLKLAIYAQLNYVKLDARCKYPDLFEETFSDAGRERTTIKLMRSMFLKRLESHVRSFIESIDRLIADIRRILKIIETVDKLDHYTASDVSGLTDINSLNDEEFDDDDYNLINTDELKVDPLDIDIIQWKPDLEYDLNILNEIRSSVIAISPENDGKLAELLRIVENKWEHPLNCIDGNNNKKVLIFTAFSDTAKELYNTLAPRFLKRGIYTGLVTGTSATSNIELPKAVKDRLSPNKFNNILTHFSPIAKNRNAIIESVTGIDAIPEIDVLIATDCVSEGQNLQDCDICINYDIHWNPVRIIQRFGRIDPKSSRNPTLNGILELS
ncbi:MAG: DEAD/DEAH box helicase family protein [Proteobacteria bacterium]|nr:DEAD/DEAH box helicase family protein [Pseudomonadota bacterium]